MANLKSFIWYVYSTTIDGFWLELLYMHITCLHTTAGFMSLWTFYVSLVHKLNGSCFFAMCMNLSSFAMRYLLAWTSYHDTDILFSSLVLNSATNYNLHLKGIKHSRQLGYKSLIITCMVFLPSKKKSPVEICSFHPGDIWNDYKSRNNAHLKGTKHSCQLGYKYLLITYTIFLPSKKSPITTIFLPSQKSHRLKYVLFMQEIFGIDCKSCNNANYSLHMKGTKHSRQLGYKSLLLNYTIFLPSKKSAIKICSFQQ